MMIFSSDRGCGWLPRVAIVFVIILCFLATGSGQEDRLYIKRLGSKDGFSANYVTSVFQDKDGYIWVGTYAGLNRYDGREVREFTPDPQRPNGISGIRVFGIVDDEIGNLWVGTTGKGLNYYNRTTNKFKLLAHDPEDETSLPSNTINAIFTDSKDRLWVGTNHGLALLREFKENGKNVFENVYRDRNGDQQFIRAIFEDASGGIWFSVNTSLFRIIEGSAVSTHEITLKGLDEFSINCITQLASGEMVISGDSGLFIEKTVGGENFVKVDDLTGISTMAYDRENDQLWVGATTGLYKYAVGRNGELPERMAHYTYDPLDPQSLSSNDITTLFIDHTRVIWAGTSGGGLNRFDPQRKQFYHHKDAEQFTGLTGSMIRAIYKDSDDRIWLGSDGGGIKHNDGALLPTEQSSFRHYEEPRRVYAILEVNNEVEHAMYFGASSSPGLYRKEYDEPGAPITPVFEVPSSVFSLFEDSRGYIWVGNYFKGLDRWIPNKDIPGGYQKTKIGQTGDHRLPSYIIRSIAEDEAGNIWVGTGDGLVKIPAAEADKPYPQFTVYQNEPGNQNSLSNNYILPILATRDGTVWVGTFGGGLNKFIPGDEGGPDRFKSYGKASGLIDEVIKAILEDENGNLWISSNDGLSRFDPQAEVFENFDINDGLQSDEFGEIAACLQDDGSMIFGGANGLTVFLPKTIRSNNSHARPAVTGMSVLNKPIEVGEERNGRVILPKTFREVETIELTHEENTISFKLNALHFAAPEKNRIAYKLEGFNEDWISPPPEQQLATYTNLPDGKYTFKLKVSNNDQVWNDDVLQFDVIVQPPFYRTNLAYAVYSLMILGFLYLLRRYSIIDIKEKNKIEMKKLDQEKTEELNQLKLQFFTNISHEFRTPLTLIAGPLESLIRNQSAIDTEQRNQYYHLMYKNSKYLLRLVNELLDFRRLEQGKLSLSVHKDEIVDYVEETVAPFEFLATKKNIDFKVIAEERPITTWFAPEVLEKILFNLLSNAFKFTPEGGRITVTVEKYTDRGKRFKKTLPGYGTLLISIADTGVGIPSKKMKRIFDRFYKGDQDDVQNNREGTGIGLAYTKSLVDLHHGLIDVTSKVGEGTTFYLRLPLDKSVYPQSEIGKNDEKSYVPQADPVDYFMPEENNREEEQNALQLKGSFLMNQEENEDSPLLLYIDDNPDLRNYIRRSFANDFRVIAADGGASGLELAMTSLPDIIISDVMMPGIDGIEVLEKLKSTPQTSHIPVILLTAKDNEESRLEGLSYGADGYVTKPFKHEALLQQILNIVQHRNILRDRFRREVITEPAEVTVTDSDELFLRQAMDIVEENMSNTEFSVDQLVREMGVSRSKLYLKLKALTGQSSSEFVRTVRLKRAVQLLENSNYSVKEVMYMTGFNTASYFSKCFKRQFGIVPSEYVNQKKNRNKA